MDLILLHVWSGLLGAGQRVLIDSPLAYRAGWGFSRRSRPVLPLSTAHFHNISGVSALQTSWWTRQVHAHSVPPRRHAAAVVRALRAIQGLMWGGREETDGRESWENSLQPITSHSSPYGKGYSTSLLPSTVTVTVILSYSVFHIYVTQHTRCKV